jgi:predicted O-methyltransferase YrrM
MFHDIPQEILDRMAYLQELDAKDRARNMATFDRLRQITPEIGEFIAILASLAPEGRFIEIGTSGGYSALWLAIACRSVGASLTTFEVSEKKARIAKESLEAAGVTDVVELVHADALQALPDVRDVSFCFLDAEKELYLECYDIVIPNMVPGGVLVADNAISHEKILRPMIDHALADTRVDSLVVPIGRGELVCRKL